MKRSKHSRRGNAMVEFALALPMLLISAAGGFQFGYYFYIYNCLENVVRAGARYASLRSYDSASATPSAAFSTAVKNVAVYGNPSGGSQPVVAGLSTNNVNLVVTMTNGIPDQLAVSITNFHLDGVFGSFTLAGKPVAVFRYEGRYAP